MLFRLVLKEVLDHLLSARFALLSLLGAVFIWLSLYDGVAYHRRNLAEYADGKAASEERRQQIIDAKSEFLWGRNNWSEVYDLGMDIQKPPVSTSIFARGLDPVVGRTFRINFFDHRLIRSPASERPTLGVFSSLDPGVTVQVVLGLFVLLFTYDAMCGEKERGTLRLTMSFPVPRYRLAAAKLLGALIPALTAFLLAFAIGVAVILMLPDIQLSRAEWVRVGLVFAVYGVYLTTLACAGLLASCLTWRTSTSFALLLAFWVSTVVVIPRVSLIVSSNVIGTPSVAELDAEMESARQDLDGERWNRLGEWEKQYEADHGKRYSSSEAGAAAWHKAFYEIVMRDHEAALRERRKTIKQDFRNRQDVWLGTGSALARLSPAFALEQATTRLAGTGLHAHQEFLEICIRFLYRFEDWAHDSYTKHSYKRMAPSIHGRYQWDVADMPRFDPRIELSGKDVRGALIDVGVLILWGAVLLATAFTKMARYDLR